MSQQAKETVGRIVCPETPKDETHWSCRGVARRVGIGHTSANLILRGHGLRPHLAKGRNYSDDLGVVGLYADPPGNAIVLCVVEKTQIQALRNVPERQSVDYLRHEIGHYLGLDEDDLELRGFAPARGRLYPPGRYGGYS